MSYSQECLFIYYSLPLLFIREKWRFSCFCYAAKHNAVPITCTIVMRWWQKLSSLKHVSLHLNCSDF